MRAGVHVSLVVGLLGAGCRPGGPTATIETARGAVRVALEVATTPAEQERGLMYRRDLPDDHGMLFVFATAARHDFWMKNTVIPLDMVFIGDDRTVVGIRPNATPLSTDPIGVDRPSRFVLEVPGGWAERRGLAVGDRVELQGVAVS